MQAEYAVELGPDDPVLDLPWSSDYPSVRYYDLKSSPELIRNIAEARDHPELAAFLTRINAATFPLQTAKCDAWFTDQIAPEEEIFGAQSKFGCYVDLLFAGDDSRIQFEKHESLAKKLCALLKQAPEIAGSAEFMIRRCYFQASEGSNAPHKSDEATHDSRESAAPGEATPGFYITAYISGFGEEQNEARRHWAIVLQLVQNALVQASAQERRN